MPCLRCRAAGHDGHADTSVPWRCSSEDISISPTAIFLACSRSCFPGPDRARLDGVPQAPPPHGPLAVALRLARSCRQAVFGSVGAASRSGRFNLGRSIWLWLIPIGLWLQAEREYARVDMSARRCSRAHRATRRSLAYPLDPGSDRACSDSRLRPPSFGRATPCSHCRSATPSRTSIWTPGDSVWSVLEVPRVPAQPHLGGGNRAADRDRPGCGALRGGVACGRSGSVGSSVAAVLLPVEPTADREAPRDDGLHDPMMLSLRSTFARRFEAERMFPNGDRGPDDPLRRPGEQRTCTRRRPRPSGRSDHLRSLP